MQISTFFYFLKKSIGKGEQKKADELILAGLSESNEPSKNSIEKIMAFSNAYCYNKSDAIGEIEYIIN